MTKGLTVSVLDLVGMRTGEPAGSAIARSVDLAQHVERLGYTRFWMAEHHSIEGLACSATPVLIGHVAAATNTIRVGSGGVMLPNHAPLVVAEQFGTLEHRIWQIFGLEPHRQRHFKLYIPYFLYEKWTS